MEDVTRVGKELMKTLHPTDMVLEGVSVTVSRKPYSREIDSVCIVDSCGNMLHVVHSPHTGCIDIRSNNCDQMRTGVIVENEQGEQRKFQTMELAEKFMDMNAGEFTYSEIIVPYSVWCGFEWFCNEQTVVVEGSVNPED